MSRMRFSFTRRLGLGAAVAVCFALCGCGGSAQSEAREAFEAFDAALRAKDLPALRGLVVKSLAAELDRPDAAKLVAAKAAEWPGDILVQGVRVNDSGSTAVVLVKGMLDGVPIGGTIQMKLEEGRWKVAMDDLTAIPAPEPEPAVGPPGVDPAVAKLMARIAATDPRAGGQAWLELAALKDYAPDYLQAAAGGFQDSRPIYFALEFELGKGPDGKPNRYLTTHLTPLAEAQDPQAKTVGEALRAVLWALEFQPEKNMDQSFADWWREYSRTKGL